MTVADTTTIVETEQHAMRRLLAKARAEGVKLSKGCRGPLLGRLGQHPGRLVCAHRDVLHLQGIRWSSALQAPRRVAVACGMAQ
jgi:hypothetical protein